MTIVPEGPVTIRDTVTGEERTVTTIIGAHDFWWHQGNMSCDCNRAVLFYGKYDDYPCGTARFLIRIPSLSYDEILYGRMDPYPQPIDSQDDHDPQ